MFNFIIITCNQQQQSENSFKFVLFSLMGIVCRHWRTIPPPTIAAPAAYEPVLHYIMMVQGNVLVIRQENVDDIQIIPDVIPTVHRKLCVSLERGSHVDTPERRRKGTMTNHF